MSIDNPFPPADRASECSARHPDRDRLRRIASAQRQVHFAVVLYLTFTPVNLAYRSVRHQAAEWASAALLLYALIVVGIGAISVYRLASIFRSRMVAVIDVLCMIVPILGLLVLLSLSRKATNELRAAGYKVGLWGVSPNAISK